MTNLRTAAQQALEAMQSVNHATYAWACVEAITALRAALAEPVQESVGYANERDLEQMRRHGGGALLWGRDQLDDLSGYTSLYTAPPQRKPLTEEEIDSIWDGEKAFADIYAIARAVERAHGIV